MASHRRLLQRVWAQSRRNRQSPEQVVGVLGKDQVDFERKWPMAKQTLGRLADLDKTALRGDPAGFIEGVKEKNRKGVTLFTMVLSDVAQDDFLATLKLFAKEVLPAFR